MKISLISEEFTNNQLKFAITPSKSVLGDIVAYVESFIHYMPETWKVFVTISADIKIFNVTSTFAVLIAVIKTE